MGATWRGVTELVLRWSPPNGTAGKSGVGEGAFAASYAVPTKGHSLEVLPLTIITEHVERFVLWANAHPD